jgi:hypothetical protein
VALFSKISSLWRYFHVDLLFLLCLTHKMASHVLFVLTARYLYKKTLLHEKISSLPFGALHDAASPFPGAGS